MKHLIQFNESEGDSEWKEGQLGRDYDENWSVYDFETNKELEIFNNHVNILNRDNNPLRFDDVSCKFKIYKSGKAFLKLEPVTTYNLGK